VQSCAVLSRWTPNGGTNAEGDRMAAISHYSAEAGRTTSIPERNYLIAQAARLAGDRQ